MRLTVKNFARRTAAFALVMAGIGPAHASEIVVSAASSLTDALGETARLYESAHPGERIRLNFAASGVLERQIEQGAPVDIFISASPLEMSALETRGLIDPRTRMGLAANRLVLVVPKGGRVRSWADLGADWVRRIALSNPGTAPSGRYGRETLERRGLWARVQPKVVYGENVRQTLVYVTGGNVDAGIVFETDALRERGRTAIADRALPGRDHSNILYEAAAIRRGANPRATAEFLKFLKGRAAAGALRRSGFRPPGKGAR